MENMEQTAETIETPTEAPATEAPSLRDTLQKAFDAPLESGPKPEAEPETPEAETEETPSEGPARGADGKFVSKSADDQPEAKAEAPAEPKKPADTTFGEAPARFSADAKAAWANAPEAVKAEAHRAIREMEQGLAQKDEQLAPLKEYMDLAAQSGTTLPDVVRSYVEMENTLRQNPVQGLTMLAMNLGRTPQELAQMLQGQQPQADPRDAMIHQLQGQIAELQKGFGGVQQTMQQQQESQVIATVEAFARENPRFDELSGEIYRLLETGYAKDLQEAYNVADRINPAPAPAIAPVQPAPAQTRQPKSVTGAPTGSNPANGTPSKTAADALKRAFGM